MLISKFKCGVNKFESFLPIYGFWGATNQVIRSIVLVGICYRFEKDLRTPEEIIVPKIPLDIISLSGNVDLDIWGIRDPLLQIRGSFGVKQAKSRLESGFVLFCAYSDSKLAGFLWLNPFPVIGAGYKLKKDEAYHIDGWTFNPYRRKGVLPALQQSIFKYLRANYPDIRILIGHASVWNKPSIIGQQRAGMVIVARELYLVFLGVHRKIRLTTMKNAI